MGQLHSLLSQINNEYMRFTVKNQGRLAHASPLTDLAHSPFREKMTSLETCAMIGYNTSNVEFFSPFDQPCLLVCEYL